jgi:hypothetical protein
MLATSGRRKKIGFYAYKFQDRGVAFVEASVTRVDESSGFAF